jgi:phosphopantetheinyl transferase
MPSAEAQLQYQTIHHPQKKLEWLASRLVLRRLVEEQGASFHGIYKDAFGKPHLNQLPFHISIAHCFPLAVGALHQYQPVGIDIERPREKLLRIGDRFLNPEEALAAGTDLDLLCKFWASKEVLYKIYGRKKLIFKENMSVAIHRENEINGLILMEDFQEAFEIQIVQFDGHLVAMGTRELGTDAHLDKQMLDR